MESVHALDLVCRHFRAEHGDAAMRLMRSQKAKLSSANYRLRQKIEKLEAQNARLGEINDRLVSTHAKALESNEQIYHTLQKAIGHVIALNYLL